MYVSKLTDAIDTEIPVSVLCHVVSTDTDRGQKRHNRCYFHAPSLGHTQGNV